MADFRDAESVAGSSGQSSGGLGVRVPAGRLLPSRIGGLSSPAPHGRLTSLRTRDLTLGGAFKKPKKTFEPNVNAVRKSKDELQEEICVTSKRGTRSRSERRKENRARRREKPQIIQSHSIFEQGPADTVHRTGWSGATDRCDPVAPPVCKTVKKDGAESEEDVDELLRRIQKDDFIDDPDLRNDAKLKPIQLPLRQSSCFLKSHTPTTCGEKPVILGAQGGAGHSGTHVSDPSLVEMLRDLRLSGQEEIFFMQLPDCMPGRASAPKADAASQPRPEKPAKKNKNDDRRTAPLNAPGAAVGGGCPVLSDFPEGFLGKLQIRKSGKVELKLGDIVMDVTEGSAFSFLQQLVSVRLSDAKTGDMMVLGNVKHKLVLSPDFQALLRQAAAPQQGT